jgi:hypothetical protein
MAVQAGFLAWHPTDNVLVPTEKLAELTAGVAHREPPKPEAKDPPKQPTT